MWACYTFVLCELMFVIQVIGPNNPVLIEDDEGIVLIRASIDKAYRHYLIRSVAHARPQ